MLSPNEWDRYVDRVLNTLALNSYLFLGLEHDGGPVMAPRDNGHTWVLDGSGQAISRYVEPVVTQMIGGGNRSVVVIDLTFDVSLLWTITSECVRAGWPLRVLDSTPGNWSHAWLADQSHATRQNNSQRSEGLVRALVPDHGPERHTFYPAANEAFVDNILAKYAGVSLEELAKLLLDPNAVSFIPPDLRHDAALIRYAFAKVAAVPWLGVEVEQTDPEVLQAAVDARQLYHQKQALVIPLNAVEAPSTSRLVAGIVIQGILAAGVREKRMCGVELVVIGGHKLASAFVESLFDGARNSGINVTLVTREYMEMLESATELQVLMGSPSLRVRDLVQRTSGTVMQPSVVWHQRLTGGESDSVGKDSR